MNHSDQVRVFFERMSAGLTVETSSDLLHSVNVWPPRNLVQVNDLAPEAVKDMAFGMGLPPMANC